MKLNELEMMEYHDSVVPPRLGHMTIYTGQSGSARICLTNNGGGSGGEIYDPSLMGNKSYYDYVFMTGTIGLLDFLLIDI